MKSSKVREREREREKEKEKTELPLLDEVSDLLSKERNLMNLKVIEQQVEAIEWKEKYETLVKKISDDTLNPAKISAYEVAADVSSAPQLKAWRNEVEKQIYLLPSSDMPWYLDMSNTSLEANDLHRILMFPKTNNYKKTTVLDLHNCDIDDSCAKLFPHLLRFPNISAIDFSCNNVADMFQNSLLAAVEQRRLKLQYFLLHGNMKLSYFPLENLVHHLASSVWGLTVSLTDVSNMTAPAPPKNPKVKKPGSSTAKSTTNNFPRHAACFLKHLNHVLDPKQGNERIVNRPANKSMGGTSQPLKSAKNTEFLQPHRGAGGTHGAPQALCVFGLMHTILCEESLSQLETTLKLTVSSLTDLDLSYSFTGIKGAKVVGNLLRRRSCQLIRLNLMGNALGDEGTSSFICPALKASQTLTYLDLKSNNVSDSGLWALTDSLNAKVTFRKLMLEGNKLSLMSVLRARSLLRKSGAPHIDVNFGPALADPMILQSHNSSPPKSSRHTIVDEAAQAVFAIPGQTSVTLDPSKGEVQLYSVASQKIKFPSARKNENNDATSLLEERMAKNNQGEMRLTWCLNICDFKETEVEMDFAKRISRATISWDVKSISHTNQATTLRSTTLLPDAFLPLGTYVSCSATVPKPQFRTQLEISVKASFPKEKGLITRTLQVKSYDLKVYEIPSDFEDSHIKYGGDMPVWSAVGNALLGSRKRESMHIAPEGFTLARRLQWIGHHALDVQLCFKTKLAAVYDVASRDSEGKGMSFVEPTWNMTEGSTVGYSWSLRKCKRVDGGMIEVASGDVDQKSAGTTELRDDDDDSNMSSDNLLRPWLWKDHTVKVEEAATNEVFMLYVKVSSNPPMSNLNNKCKVQVSNCEFFVAGENYEIRPEAIYETQSNPALVYSTFDDCSLSMAI